MLKLIKSFIAKVLVVLMVLLALVFIAVLATHAVVQQGDINQSTYYDAELERTVYKETGV